MKSEYLRSLMLGLFFGIIGIIWGVNLFRSSEEGQIDCLIGPFPCPLAGLFIIAAGVGVLIAGILGQLKGK